MGIDYQKIGFKSGLEIHQQLDSHKLFCNCPSILRKDSPDYEIKRRLHVVAGEGGEIDVAAEHEATLEKEFVYQGYDSTCLVELDEEPPHKINEEALQIALHISLLLNCTIQPITQVMRKTVIDGSNTSGFQRTVMVARDGYLETSKGRVGISYVYLEEDAARTIEEVGNSKIYRLDRLGTPLVEIVTAPDIKDSEHAKETALLIGEILRSCKVKRGIGTIRQDINVSVDGHPRAEIKGFQDPKVFVEVVDKEIERQLDNLENKNELKDEVRGANEDNTTRFLRPLPGSARMYPETDLPLLHIHKKMIDEAKRNLPKLRSEIEEDLKKQGLSEEYIRLLFKQNKVEEYKQVYYNFPKANFVAQLILVLPKELAKRNNLKIETVSEIIESNILDVLNLFNKKKIKEDEIKIVLENLVDGKSLDEAMNIDRIEISDIEEEIHKLIKSKPGLSANAYMGLVMKEYAGRVNGSEAREIIRKFVG